MDKTVISAIGVVGETAASLKMRFALIGALVLELRLSRPLKENPPRETLDADFIVAVRGWKDYERLMSALGKENFQPTRMDHRLARDGALIDVLPVGREIAPEGKLVWPKSEHVMNIVGCEEALECATPLQLQPGLEIPVVTIPAFTMLKIMAFGDRKDRASKWKSDAKDILYCMDRYEDIRQSERRYSVPEGLAGIDVNDLGASLLGMDLAKLNLRPQARSEIRRFLQQADDEYSDFVNALADRLVDEQEQAARSQGLAYIRAFGKGYSLEGP